VGEEGGQKRRHARSPHCPQFGEDITYQYVGTKLLRFFDDGPSFGTMVCEVVLQDVASEGPRQGTASKHHLDEQSISVGVVIMLIPDAVVFGAGRGAAKDCRCLDNVRWTRIIIHRRHIYKLQADGVFGAMLGG
jgi:hypothetical protein